MANSIVLAKDYLPVLDEVYKRASLTSRLDAANERMRWDGAKSVYLFETEMDGFGDYSRANGFPQGDVTSGWREYTLERDRGISLSVDAMDNEETMDMAWGTLVGEFGRTKEVPEVDAYTFAKIASASGISGAQADITVGTTDCPALIDTAEQVMGDDEVPRDGNFLYVSETFYNGIKQKIVRHLANENGVNREVEYFNEMEVVRVPKTRFNTAITLNDGTDNFGYTVTAGGYPINFMIINPQAIRKFVKHRMPRIWTPNENINADAFKFDLRLYYDVFVLHNKVKGVYVHKASTANV